MFSSSSPGHHNLTTTTPPQPPQPPKPTGIFSVFGDSFVHGGRPGALPVYQDPEELLAAPTVDRFVPFRPDDGF